MKKWLYGFFYIAIVITFSMVFSYTYIKLNAKNSVFIDNIYIEDVPSHIIKGEDEEPVVTPEPVVTSPVSPTPLPTNVPKPTSTPVPTSVPKPTQTPVPTSTPVPTNTPVPTSTPTPNVNPNIINYAQENIKISNKITSEYGIGIKYGSSISSYTVSGMTIVPITDEKSINEYLNTIYNVLKQYPSGMFKEISNYGFRLSFYLVTRFATANVAGVTEQRNLNVVITLATDYEFIETLNHELFHYFDAYMDILGNTNPSWALLNPSDFTYGRTNSNYSFFTTFKNNAYFVNDYAQTDEYEDRAVIFEYMMADYELKCFENGTPIYKKARLISETLDQYFNSVTSTNVEYWERYIK